MGGGKIYPVVTDALTKSPSQTSIPETTSIQETISAPKALPGFPVPNSSKSYWRSEPSWLDELRSTPTLPSSCDIVIIGGGFAGVSTAWHILKSHFQSSSSLHPPPAIILLEARQICSGATGRNGGHIKLLPSGLPSWVADLGEAQTEELHAFVRANQYAVKQLVEDEGIQCQGELRRSFDVALDEEGAKEMVEGYKHLKKIGLAGLQDVDVVEGENVNRITSMPAAKAALSTPVYSLQPYKLVTQLLERCLDLGLQVHANTPVTSLEEDTQESTSSLSSGPHTTIVHTLRGSILADKVIFATNGYTPALLPQYKSIITPVKGTACHIAVPHHDASSSPPANHDKFPAHVPPPPNLSNTYNIKYTSSRVDYMNPRPDGSIVIGGAAWTFKDQKGKWWDTVDDSTVFEEAKPHFEGVMQASFTGWEGSGARVEMLWSGIQGYTPDRMPHVGRVPGGTTRTQKENQFVLAGFNGGGMAMIFLTAKAVAGMVTAGQDFGETGLPGIFETTEERLRPRVE